MNQLEMEKQFDKIYDETIPLVLFSTVSDRKEYGDFLSSLFILYIKGNAIAFNEVYDLLVKKLSDKQKYDRHQDENIKSFHNRYLSFNQRMENIEKTYLEFKSMVEQINQDHIRLNNQGKSLKRISPTVNMMKRKGFLKTIEKDVINVSNKDVKSKLGVCPICNTKLYTQKRTRGVAFYCKENNRYKHWFRTDSNNKFYYCKKCNAVMLGSGKTLRCSKCDNKQKVIE